mgnify:CR=1 FL=1
MKLKQWVWATGFSWGAWSLIASGVLAAETVLLRYRGLGLPVPVEALQELAETGEAPASIDQILEASGQDPQDFQATLTRQISVNVNLLDRTLNSWPGEWALDQVGEVIHPPSGEASRQALRSALVLSAADDAQISILEILENYPTRQVVLEVDKIEAAYNRLAALLRPFSLF